MRAWNADRTARVGAHRERSEARGCGDTRSTTRSARRPGQVVRIERLTGVRADRRQAKGELVQVHLAKHHRSGTAQHPYLIRVLRGHDADEGKRAAGGRHVGGVVVIFQQDWDTVQRTAGAALAALAITAGIRNRR